MARLRIKDKLQNYQFHLLDISYSLSVPPFVLNPLASFSAITTPEMTLETEEVAEGNSYFKRHVISGGSVSSITLQRGASFFDSEFWNWISACIRGQVGQISWPVAMSGKRRNLLLIQFTGYSARGFTAVSEGMDALASMAAGFLPNVGGILRIPARAWILIDCLPTRYKPASDFDATSGDISIMELELQMDRFEEFSMGGSII